MRRTLRIFLAGGLVMTTNAVAAQWKDVCKLDSVALPKGVDPQIGAVDRLPGGGLIVAFHRGEVMKLVDGKWSLWASGLHEPLGMHVVDENTVVVVQRAELTEISDRDKDGTADLYKTLTDDWGMSGNYHEFAFGAAKAQDGSFYVSLGTASNGGGVRPEIRGAWNDAGGITFDYAKPTWGGEDRTFLPRMYSRVPYRGWVVKVDPATGEMTPIASGLRTPHGVHVTPEGDLYVNDNQGDWLGSSKLYKIEQGKFYGHPDSLIWRKGWSRGVPSKLSPTELDKLREKCVCFLPQGDLANSPTQILTLPKDEFGPYGGNLIMGEMNQPQLVRYLPDVVNGKQQGAALKFLKHPKLGRGNTKMVLSNKNEITIGKTHLSWAGGEGMARLQYLDKPHLAITGIHLTEKGFRVELNGAAKQGDIKVSGSYYGLHYHNQYGSPKVDPQPVKAMQVIVKGDAVEVELEKAPEAGRIYDVSLEGVESGELGGLLEPRFFYTAHEVVKP